MGKGKFPVPLLLSWRSRRIVEGDTFNKEATSPISKMISVDFIELPLPPNQTKIAFAACDSWFDTGYRKNT
jgi:hypothetical protein